MNDNSNGVAVITIDGGSEDSESDLWRFLAIFYRYKWMLIGVVLLSLVATFFLFKKSSQSLPGQGLFFLSP